MKFIQCTRPVYIEPFYKKSQHYDAFIRAAVRDLEKGEKVYLFYDYQVEDIKNIYGNEVTITYNKKYNWWEAVLI